MSNIDIVREAIEERDAMEQQLYDLANHMTYQGNSVSWWHSKAVNYSNALGDAWDALSEAGIACDGKTSVADGIKMLAAKKGLKK